MPTGQRISSGTRIPPSYSHDLPARSGALVVTVVSPPLSEVNIIKVLSSRPSFLSVWRICPTPSSMLSIIAASNGFLPVPPAPGLRSYFAMMFGLSKNYLVPVMRPRRSALLVVVACEMPLADQSRCIAGRLHALVERDIRGGEKLDVVFFQIIRDARTRRVLARHQRRARR